MMRCGSSASWLDGLASYAINVVLNRKQVHSEIENGIFRVGSAPMYVDYRLIGSIANRRPEGSVLPGELDLARVKGLTWQKEVSGNLGAELKAIQPSGMPLLLQDLASWIKDREGIWHLTPAADSLEEIRAATKIEQIVQYDELGWTIDFGINWSKDSEGIWHITGGKVLSGPPLEEEAYRLLHQR